MVEKTSCDKPLLRHGDVPLLFKTQHRACRRMSPFAIRSSGAEEERVKAIRDLPQLPPTIQFSGLQVSPLKGPEAVLHAD